MAHTDKFSNLDELIRNVDYAITDLADKDKVLSIVDRLLRYHARNEYGYDHFYEDSDTETYEIIENSGFDQDQLAERCSPSKVYRSDVLEELGALTQTELFAVKCCIGTFVREEQNGIR